MNQGKLVFAQVMEHLPMHTFRRLVERFGTDRGMRSFSSQDQFRAMAFAQLTYRDSLRDTAICLEAQSAKLYHMGFRSPVARATLADANEMRDWRLYAAFAQALIVQARKLYADDAFGADLANTAYALDTTTIDLCLSLFPWAPFERSRGAVKMHTQMDLRGNIPVFVHIDHGRSYDTDILDVMVPEAGAIYVMDRGYVDFARLRRLDTASAFFVVRAKKTLRFERRTSHPIDKSNGLQCDQSIVLASPSSRRLYPDTLRRIRYRDPETGQRLVFLTNNFALPAQTIPTLYRCRWQIELFFKWIKQNLRIKSFFGRSENAVKTQIWIAVAVYVLVAILKKRLKIEASLYTILQSLSVTIFEKIPLDQLFGKIPPADDPQQKTNFLNLLDN